MTKRTILILPLLILALMVLAGGCDQSEETINNAVLPTGANAVDISAVTNCAPTQVAGEIRLTDESQPASVIDRVTGTLFNGTGASVCNWNISRVGNAVSSDTCRNLTVAGAYSFRGHIHLNNGQDPTPVEGGCTLTNTAFQGVSIGLSVNTDAFDALLIERGMSVEQALGN